MSYDRSSGGGYGGVGVSQGVAGRVDLQAAKTWVYPTNYPVRQYQLEICEKALFLNTLVCLPTGLGKTLIAAVVMYNYYRWFPTGKILFMAPTRPLVSQQMAACRDIMSLPMEDTTNLEGSIAPERRAQLWKDNRVIFCTPQTAHNDLKDLKLDPQAIVCVVIDEAHKATGGYAYTNFIELLSQHQSQYRVLALSATPGSDVKKIQNVLFNLRIAHIEVRTEDDEDVAPYVHDRHIEVLKCANHKPASVSQILRHEIHSAMEEPLSILRVNQLIICNNVSFVNNMMVDEVARNWPQLVADLHIDQFAANNLRQNLNAVKLLVECKKALNDDGVKGLSVVLEREYSKNGQMFANIATSLLEKVKTCKNDPSYLMNREPKIAKLKEVLIEHFASFAKEGKSTRALVFSHFRSSVMEIKKELIKVTGLKPREFVGQNMTKVKNDDDEEEDTIGLTQAEQQEILRQFNLGAYNVLIATSIAEEGLDIAEVDLIVLLDSVSSPIKLAQRMGRTGRKRAGRIVLISSPSANGVENDEDKLEQSKESVKTLNTILKRASRAVQLYPKNPVMIPSHIQPVLSLQEMKTTDKTVPSSSISQPLASQKPSQAASSSLSRFFSHAPSTTNSNNNSNKGSHDSLKELAKNSSAREVIDLDRSEQDQLPDEVDPFAFTFADDTVVPKPVPRITSKQEVIIDLLDDEDDFQDILPKKAASTKSSSQFLFTQPEEYLPTGNFTVDVYSVLDDDDGEVHPAASASKQLSASSASLPSSASNLLNAVASKPKHISPVASSSRNVDNSFLPDCTSPLISGSSSDEESEIDLLELQSKRSLSPIGRIQSTNLSTHSFSDMSASAIDFSNSRLSEHAGNSTSYLSKLKNTKASSSAPTSFLADEDMDIMPTQDVAPPSPPRPSRSSLPPRPQPAASVVGKSILQKPSPAKKGGMKEIIDLDGSLSDGDQLKDTPVRKAKSPVESRVTWSDAKPANNKSEPTHFCCICLESDRSSDSQMSTDEEDDLVMCNGKCRSILHRSCYGDTNHDHAVFKCELCSEKGRFADSVQCALCFQSGGLMKRATTGEYVHLICVLFTNELTLSEAEMRPNNIRQLDKDRKGLYCRLCSKWGGGCVQCAHGDCMEAFHPYCAFRHQRQMLIWEKGDVLRYDLLCQKHQHHLPPTSCIISKTTTSSNSNSYHGSLKSEHPAVLQLCDTPLATSSEVLDYMKSSTPQEKQARKRLRKGGEAYQPEKKKKKLGEVSRSTKRQKMQKYFELEADMSGSDHHGEDEELQDSSQDSDQLSGDFINDGSFTQIGTPAGHHTQTAFYLGINREKFDEDSPTDYVNGHLPIADLVRRKKSYQEEAEARGGYLQDSILEDSFDSRRGTGGGKQYGEEDEEFDSSFVCSDDHISLATPSPAQTNIAAKKSKLIQKTAVHTSPSFFSEMDSSADSAVGSQDSVDSLASINKKLARELQELQKGGKFQNSSSNDPKKELPASVNASHSSSSSSSSNNFETLTRGKPLQYGFQKLQAKSKTTNTMLASPPMASSPSLVKENAVNSQDILLDDVFGASSPPQPEVKLAAQEDSFNPFEELSQPTQPSPVARPLVPLRVSSSHALPGFQQLQAKPKTTSSFAKFLPSAKSTKTDIPGADSKASSLLKHPNISSLVHDADDEWI